MPALTPPHIEKIRGSGYMPCCEEARTLTPPRDFSTPGGATRAGRSSAGAHAEPSLRKLRNRLLTVNLVGLTFVIAISFSIIYLNFYNRTLNDIDETISSIPRGVYENVVYSRQWEGAMVTSVAMAGEDRISISGSARIPVDYSKSFVANVMDDGTYTVFSILDLDNDTYIEAIDSALEGNKPSGYVTIAGRAWRYSLTPGLVISGSGPAFFPQNEIVSYRSSVVFLDVEDMRIGLGALAMSLIVIGAVAIAAVLLVSLYVANRAIRPVEESMARQKRFVSDASHELKTPIAIIAANAEAAAITDTPADISRWIGNISDEATRMGGLVESLLKLARAEEGQKDRSPFDLVAAVNEETGRVEAFLFEKGITFEFLQRKPENGPLLVRSDRTKVQAALSVLLENAVKYTPEGGRVTVTVGKGNRKTDFYISVANTGAYIPPEDIARIFDRFFRTDPSRGSETGGHGIGLSIAKEIALSLGGDLTATSAPRADGGAINTFTILIV